MIELELPYPPSLNHYYRTWQGRTLISRAGRSFRERVCGILALRGVSPIQGPLAVVSDVYPPDNRRRDLDNTQKALLDAMQHGNAYADDGQIKILAAIQREQFQDGKVAVRIAALPLQRCPLCGGVLECARGENHP